MLAPFGARSQAGPQRTGVARFTIRPRNGKPSAMRDDRADIAALIFAYAERLDAGDFGGVADLFTYGTLRSEGQPGALSGREEVLALYTHTVRLYDGRPRTRHVTTNVVIDLGDDDTATARAYFTVFQASPELPLQPIVAGRYVDRFLRRDGAWWFAERVIVVELVGDVRHHLTPQIAALLGQ